MVDTVDCVVIGANDVTDLVWLTRTEARVREPELECRFALHSPSTGIIDSHGFMNSLLADLEAGGGAVAFRSPVSGGYFYAAIRAYWPALPDGALLPGYAGIRPKLQAPGGPPADFLIQGPETHGVPSLVNLFGIESPGLTAALAIAEQVSGLI
jgi:L-2-hydroxyglutarate oxidase LhgO